MRWADNLDLPVATPDDAAATEPSPAGGSASVPDSVIAAVLDQWPVGVIVANAEGEVVYANPEVARIWGEEPATESFRRYSGLRPDGSALAMHDWPLARSLTSGEVVRAEEIHFERDDGVHGVMEVSSAPLRVGRLIVGGVVLFVDVSERHAGAARATLLQRWTGDLATTDAREVLATLALELATVLRGEVHAYAIENDEVTALAGAPAASELVHEAVRAGSIIDDRTDGAHAVPLIVRARTLGVIEHSGSGRNLDAPTREVLLAVVRQGAHALERALAVEAERAARRAADRLHHLAEQTAAIMSSLEAVTGFEARLDALAVHLSQFADWCLIELQGGTEVVRVAAASEPDREADAHLVAGYPSRPRDPVRATGEAGGAVCVSVVPPGLIDHIVHDQRHRDALLRLGVESLVVVPFRLERESLAGTIALAAGSAGQLGPSEMELVEAVAAAAEPALERERARDRERRVAATLQERLLPKLLTTIEGALVGHRYRAGADEMLVGGDWIDTFALPGGRLGLVVGDVVGRGVEAAATMGQLRSALVALAMDGDDPSRVLRALDRYVALNVGRSTTLVYAIADPADRSVRYSCAGHLPPLLVDRSGARFAAGGQGGPLGVWRFDRTEAVVHLDLGGSVVLCTDGLVERRGEALDVGLARVEHAAAALGEDLPDALCAGLLDSVLGGGAAPLDDVAVLAVQLCDPASTFMRRVPAYPRLLRSVRHDLRDWLRHAGLALPVIDDVVLACGEACANVVEHAYRDMPTGELAVEGHLSERAVVCTVRDFGRWRTSDAVRPGGRGFGLMGELVDEIDVERTSWGTRVQLRHRR